jgi:uncharacterized membrane protein
MIPIYTTIALSLFGFLLCIKIFRDKRKPQPIVCFVGANCEKVVRSDFSSFLGIGLEIFGALYYLFILSFYTFLAFVHLPYIEILTFGTLIISGMAFMFSLFLTFIQAVVIKSWCSWCLLSAIITTLILVSGLVRYFYF